MNIDGWMYYNHAIIPTSAPHKPVNMLPLEDGSIWKVKSGGHTPLLVRWHSDWDCGDATNWWYVIKDTPFEISSIKSKRRYEINKGNKNFEVKEIVPSQYKEQIFSITSLAYETYPVSYRPLINHDSFVSQVGKWNFYRTYGAFEIGSNQLCGYANLLKEGEYINFVVLKVIPDKEKLAINAAIINKILVDHEVFLNSGGYICDGSRSIQHETAFQDYLEKYFEFRKAYCKLHIIYKPLFKIIVNITFPIRRLLKNFDGISVINTFNKLLYLEEINRSFKQRNKNV